MIKQKQLSSLLLIFVAFVVMGISTYVATQRELSGLENVLLQTFSLIFGLVGSYYFGKQSTNDAAKEIIKPHARSAFRRLLSLYKSLHRVAVEIENSKNSNAPQYESVTLAKLEAIIIEQLATADDALEDWRDIVPEEVTELIERLTTSRYQRPNQ
jgi:hypothetical protein